jgi:predicted TIM-barrel fold metal-dependent hydrolase
MTTTDRIISADSHVNPPFDIRQQYLPPAYRDRAPRLERTDEGDFVVFEGTRRPYMLLGALAGKDFKDYKLTGRAAEARPGGWDPVERLKDQDLDGLDAEVLYGGALLRSQDAGLRLAGYRAYNHWLADFCGVAPNRLIGMAEIPMDSVEIALHELRRVDKKGLRGAIIPAFPPKSSYAEPAYEPLWTEAEALGLPVHFHLGARSYEPRPEDSWSTSS